MNENDSPKFFLGGGDETPKASKNLPPLPPPPPRLSRPCLCRLRAGGLKAAVHWERPGCALAQSSPNITWADVGLHADSARPQRVSGSAHTDSRRAESARNPIASHIKFGDDSALNALARTQWMATLSLMEEAPTFA